MQYFSHVSGQAPDEMSFIVNRRFVIDRVSRRWVATSTPNTNYLPNGDFLGHFGDTNLKGGRCKFPREEINALLGGTAEHEAVVPISLYEWFKKHLEPAANSAAGE